VRRKEREGGKDLLFFSLSSSLSRSLESLSLSSLCFSISVVFYYLTLHIYSKSTKSDTTSPKRGLKTKRRTTYSALEEEEEEEEEEKEEEEEEKEKEEEVWR
jgi:hypothetical protein